MLIGISYRTSTTCPECRQEVPVSHLRPTMLCSHCQATTDRIGAGIAWWTDDTAGDFATRLVLKRPEGNVGHTKTSKFSLEFFRGPADCPECHHPMTNAGLDAGLASGAFKCPCGFSCPCRAAEPSLVERFGYARWLLGEAPDESGAPKGEHAIMVACMSCGAGLKVDGSSRTVDCQYCNMANYLPDGLWLRLHPAPRLEWFRLVIEIDERSLATECAKKHALDCFLPH